MNWKLIALLLVLALAIWAPTLPATDAPAGCPCCKEMSKDGGAATDCCKDGKCADCCKDCAGCKDGKCGECCKDGNCKDGKCACCGKADDKTAKSGCCGGGKMCNRHAHGNHGK